MDGEEHYGILDLISKCFIPICNPYQLSLAVSSADVSTELDQCGVHLRLHGIRLSKIRCAFNGDSSLIVVPRGLAPGAVLLINAKADPAISPDGIIAACLSLFSDKAAADSFDTKLTNHRMRGNSADGAGPFA